MLHGPSAAMNTSALLAYAIASSVLCIQLLLLWMASGLVRGRTKTTLNPEDAAAFGSVLVDTDPPAVARMLRVHANGQATVYPFLVLGLVFVLLGGGIGWAAPIFAAFVAARLLHTLAYLREWQPWRSVFFLVGMLATVTLAVRIAWLVLQA